VYFVARGVLGEGPNVQGQVPIRGADNLYVYDVLTGRVAFIADLCLGPGASGVVEDVRCPANLGEGNFGGTRNDTKLWTSEGETRAHAQTAGVDGGFLVFRSYGQLVAGDTDTTSDIYRYDAETGVLERVSVGEDGYGSNGNNNAFDAEIGSERQWLGLVQEQYAMHSRAVSEEGSRIVFTTAEPLSPGATNGLENAYEWHQEPGASEGEVSLISSGSGSQSVNDVVISADGKNVFFLTSQGLVAQDTDGAPDVYDARLGAGFPAQAAPPQECSGDACQGPLTNPAPLLVPGSVSQAPGENLSPTVPPVKVKPRAKSVKCRQGYVKRKSKCVRRNTKDIKAKAKKSDARHTSTDRRGS